jgi:type I restriction enzyme R subunit
LTVRTTEKNARVHVATYQTLGLDKHTGSGETAARLESFLTRFYPENYFSHIVIDECHRSAWGSWKVILERNARAVQVGLTATPRKLKINENTEEVRNDEAISANNYTYFGEPVYEYGLAQAMEDGYLAACEILLAQVNLDATGLTLADIVRRNPRNANTGQPLTAAQIADAYERTDYEKSLLLPDRINGMCLDLFNHLIASDPDRGPLQKTIIFCARDRHADDVASALNNLYAQWCKTKNIAPKSNYAFKCTAAGDGNAELPDFKGSASSHFIATTVDLLTTGVDVPGVRNIAFFRYIKSPITFYQMVGRGTRIQLPDKLMFRVYDYTGATRLFGQDFITKPAETGNGGDGPQPPPPPPPLPPITVDGFDVHISPLGRYVVAPVDGRAMPVSLDDYKAGLSAQLAAECPTLADFRARWINPPDREEMVAAIVSAGYSPSVLRLLEDMNDYDLFDVLADLAYGLAPRTRADRTLAFGYKNATWLNVFPPDAKATIEAIAHQFALSGTEGLENRHIFEIPEVIAAGGLKALAAAGEPAKLLREAKERMFTA